MNLNSLVVLLLIPFDPVNFYCSEFCSIVRKIFIYTSEEVKKLSPKIKLPVNDDSKPAKPGVDMVVNPEDCSSVVGHGC